VLLSTCLHAGESKADLKAHKKKYTNKQGVWPNALSEAQIANRFLSYKSYSKIHIVLFVCIFFTASQHCNAIGAICRCNKTFPERSLRSTDALKPDAVNAYFR
jgi:hypothetical protein